MSEPSANIFDDPNSSHPLDLLINAISGSGEYQIPQEARDGDGEFNLEQLLNNNSGAEAGHGSQDDGLDRGKRKRQDESPDPRSSKIAKNVTSHIVHAANRQRGLSRSGQRHTPSTFSTIEVWHPTAGQKSYGKERRMLNPPPILRVTGPLLPQLTKATLHTSFTDDHSRHTPLSAQTHRIPLTYQPPEPTSLPPGLRPKRQEREAQKMKIRDQASRYGFGQTLPYERRKRAEKEREALSEGLGFPGLWVGEGIGRHKEFRLELSLGFPNDESAETEDKAQSSLKAGSENTQPVLDDKVDPVLENEGLPTPAPSADLPSAGQEHSQQITSELFPDHQTLEEASHDIKQYLVDEQGRNPDSAPTYDHPSARPPQDTSGPSAVPQGDQPTPAPRTWATFLSSPLAVVSKPSQKTSKARSMTSCLTLNDSFALWVRIHGQTVRTKYMKLDVGTEGSEPGLTTRTSQWTPFRFEVVDRADPFDRAGPSAPNDRASSSRRRAPIQTNNILTYGSIGRLVDLQSGIKTDPMRLVKIDRNENVVGTDHGHPVSDLQRVGFVRVVDGQNDDFTGGGRWYLSAPGARLGGAEVTAPTTQSQPIQPSEPGHSNQEDIETLDSIAEVMAAQESTAAPESGRDSKETAGKPKKKKKTKRFALAEVVVAEDAGGAEFALHWAKASRFEAERARGFGRDLVKKTEICEKVEDWMCWTLGGVASFSYSFFDGAEGLEVLPQAPIDPIPRSLCPPTFRPDTNTLELILSDFFSLDHLNRSEPYQVYLGPLGPLQTSLYRSIAPPKAGPDDGVNPHFEAVPYSDSLAPGEMYRSIRSDWPCTIPHVIVVVDMPRAEEIIRTMQECFAEAQYKANSTLQAVSSEVTEAEGWLTSHDQVRSSAKSQPIESLDISQKDQQTNANHIESQPLPVNHEQQSQSHSSDSFMPGTLGQGDLGLDQIFNPPHDQSRDRHRHDVDDITAALSNAQDTEFALSGSDYVFLTANLDPALQDTQSSTTIGLTNDTIPAPSDAHKDAETLDQSAPREGVDGATRHETGTEQSTNPAVDTSNPMSASLQSEATPPSLRLLAPQVENNKIEMVPLPFVLVRKSDGVGFGVGRNVVAERVDSQDKPRWGLRVVTD